MESSASVQTRQADSLPSSNVKDGIDAKSEALDLIHTSASQSDALIAFDDFSVSPLTPSLKDSNESTGDLVQNGLTQLISRFRDAVDAAKEKAGSVVGAKEQSIVDYRPTAVSSPPSTSASISTTTVPDKTATLGATTYPSALPFSKGLQLQQPNISVLNLAVTAHDDRQSLTAITSDSSFSREASTSSTLSQNKMAHTLLAKLATCNPVNPTVAPVNVSASRGGCSGGVTVDGPRQDGSARDSPAPQNPSRSTELIRKTPIDHLSQGVLDTSSLLRGTNQPSLVSAATLGNQTPQKYEHYGAYDHDGPPSLGVFDEVQASDSSSRNRADESFEKVDRQERQQNLAKFQERNISAQPSLNGHVMDLADNHSSARVDSEMNLQSQRMTPSLDKDFQEEPPNRHQTQERAHSDLSLLPTFNVSRASSLNTPETEINNNPPTFKQAFGGGVTRRSRSSSRRRRPEATPAENRSTHVAEASKQIRSRVLSKDFWMRDENCTVCYECGDIFSTFRRKHHCRTCGQIFDAKCTSLVSGAPYGHAGSLRVCRPCKEIINSYDYTHESQPYGEDLPSMERTGNSDIKIERVATRKEHEIMSVVATTQLDFNTPMMTIPATRTAGAGSKRGSAILEIDAEDSPSRPSSSRSFKTPTGSRPLSLSHKRHRSRLFHARSIRAIPEDRAPFHRTSAESQIELRLPAFHNDSIIDPELAPYMSDDGSSADEQMSLSAAMNGDVSFSGLGDNDKHMNWTNSPRKGRTRLDDMSSGAGSALGREIDSPGGAAPRAVNSQFHSHTRSTYGGSPTQRLLPRVPKGGNLLKTLGALPDVLGNLGGSSQPPSHTQPSRSRMTKSASMTGDRAPPVELNHASLQHVRKLLRQLLHDSRVLSIDAWEHALMPILLQCTDDVNPDIRRGDDIDIRHYVKIKRIPSGHPSDTSYISGVVFSKNLALKCMPRNISHPRIVIITFPIEYHRHQQHFMSLGPVIAQEKEYLASLVNRILALRPQVLLAQRNISGLALQYLADKCVATAYNVKPAVLEAVSRCAETEIISSVDMLVLKSVHIGWCDGLDVKTYVHKDIPGKKKTFMYLSGCTPDLGCTVVLRGESMSLLAEIKQITEFMVYVVYSLKLETCLMRDEFVLIPSATDGGTLSHGSGVETRNLLCQAEDNSFQPTSSAKFPDPNSHNQNQVEASHQKGDLEATSLDVPIPNYYGDMVEKYQTKILSASPFVKFMQPYLLMRAREQESRLVCLRRLQDQDMKQKQAADGKSSPQRFALVQPEMVHQVIQDAPQKVMEVLHAIHDAEYDKALYIYETQKRQWEAYIAGNIDLFDPYAHQNIVVLHSLVCTATATPCIGPDLLALAYYNEHTAITDFTPDCTLGQFVEDLCFGAHEFCSANSCDRPMLDHHRSYVHGEGRISVFLESYPCKLRGLQDSILMWSCCKLCKKETQVVPMSQNTWRYSFGKYLEISFWSCNLRLKAGICPHDLHRDHLRYFGYHDLALRVHYDPIELLEIVVPRPRITWNVESDLRLKNDLYLKIEDRLNRFMASVKSRLKGISANTNLMERVEDFKAEIEKLTKRANDDHVRLLRKLQKRYMNSKYYEIIPLNRAVRALQTKVAEWDTAFTEFEAEFFPSEKDIRRLAIAQMKRMLMDKDTTTPPTSTTDDSGSTHTTGSEGPQRIAVPLSADDLPSSTQKTSEPAHDVFESSVEERGNLVRGAAASETPRVLSSSTGEETILDENFAIEAQSNDQKKLDQQLDTSTTPNLHRSVTDISSLSPPLLQELLAANSNDQATTSACFKQPTSTDRSVTSPVTRQDTVLDVKPSKTSNIPRLIEGYRKGKLIDSPPLIRTQSQPIAVGLEEFSADRPSTTMSVSPSGHEPSKALKEEFRVQKLLQAKGLDGPIIRDTKQNKRPGRSNIPRSVPSKTRESQVSTLAQHFEQLSREFEKERLRERQQRAASTKRARVNPVASSKPTVEVYQNVLDAVDEREISDQEAFGSDPTRSNTIVTTSTGVITDQSTAPTSIVQSPTESFDRASKEAETDQKHEISDTGKAGTERDSGDSDESDSLSTSLQLPSHEDISETQPHPDIKVELPKHERLSVMKMLTSFWAERSASGWAPLDYPMAAFDHIFLDSDVIIREDEPSSLIAFALNSEDYKAKLQSIREHSNGEAIQNGVEEPISPRNIKGNVESSLLRSTGTHLKYQFQEGSARMLCKIVYAEQFDAVRRQCGVADRIVESLSRCVKWDSKGGKTRSVFLKTLDERFVLKSLSAIETQAFLRFAPAYFQIMSEALFHELPSVIAKMFGFYQIYVKNPATGSEIKLDLLVMENLFYDRTPTRIFDLKGSMRNRKIQSTGKQDEVLLDENMVEFIYESPLFAREHSKKLLRASVWNDTLFLARQNVMDYSLMIAVDESRKELVVGIIDCIRTYTWDKKLESWIKDRGFAGGSKNKPTVTSPKEYKSRFREAMARYVLQAPNCWHQFQAYRQAEKILPTTNTPSRQMKELETEPGKE